MVGCMLTFLLAVAASAAACINLYIDLSAGIVSPTTHEVTITVASTLAESRWHILQLALIISVFAAAALPASTVPGASADGARFTGDRAGLAVVESRGCRRVVG